MAEFIQQAPMWFRIIISFGIMGFVFFLLYIARVIFIARIEISIDPKRFKNNYRNRGY